MDLITLIGMFAAIAVVFTLIGKFLFKQSNLPINFLRYFVGVWFVFSGVVKAIDPAGTAIKMEEYFMKAVNSMNNITADDSRKAPLMNLAKELMFRNF